MLRGEGCGKKEFVTRPVMGSQERLELQVRQAHPC